MRSDTASVPLSHPKRHRSDTEIRPACQPLADVVSLVPLAALPQLSTNFDPFTAINSIRDTRDTSDTEGVRPLTFQRKKCVASVPLVSLRGLA